MRVLSWTLALALTVALLIGAWAITPEPFNDGVLALVGRAPSAAAAHRFTPMPAGSEGEAAACVVCHSVEKGGPFRVAPGLYGIVGGDKARARWYGYSNALATAEGVWTEDDLDRYLADPDGYLPGTKKTLIGLPEAEREEIIAYLRDLQD